ncbi:hypothetical protein Tco_0152728 [Tanacetum coccineum]
MQSYLPYIGNFMLLTPDLSYTGLDEFVNKHIVENKKSDKEVSKVVRKSDDSPFIEDWVSDNEEEDVSQPKIEKKTVRPSIVKKEFGNPQMDLQDQGVIDSGCSRHMTGNMSNLTDYEEIDGGCVAFGGNPKGGKITGKEKSTSGFTGLRSKNRKRVLVRKRTERIAKPAESEGFEQIVDFLNAHTIKYSLTVNPIIYTSCIEQFWATDKAKTVNGDVQIQALVDGKKIINTELIVRRDL